MYYLYDHLEPGSFKPSYADTDRKGLNMVPILVPNWYYLVPF